MQMVDHRLSIAPMMGYTDREYRFIMRKLSRYTVFYTEMVHTGAILHGNKAQHLEFHPSEKPLVLQLGGDRADDLAKAAQIGVEYGYDEINLNCGCPSSKVQNGNFGAVLMKNPNETAKLVRAMVAAAGPVPVTVKHRIGITDKHSYAELVDFVSAICDAGASRLIVHARMAVLEGLSPKENRDIPPLQYEWVHTLKQKFMGMDIHLNGGVRSLSQAHRHLSQLDGVMIGRLAIEDPWVFAQADAAIFGAPENTLSRHEIVQSLFSYFEHRLSDGVSAHRLFRHLLNFFHGIAGSRGFRRILSENMHKSNVGVELLEQALEKVVDLSVVPIDF